MSVSHLALYHLRGRIRPLWNHAQTPARTESLKASFSSPIRFQSHRLPLTHAGVRPLRHLALIQCP
jgi:hypothetical protein